MIKLFFENISYRMCSENCLSDITWALCNASSTFKEIFLKLFFPDMQISPDITIERELSKNGSRVDFFITNGEEEYLIENKIYDNNQHFGQYDKIFNVKPERFGYIANYPISQPKIGKTYQIRTWEDFYKKLEIQVEDNQEQMLIDGYRKYLKSVCNIIEFNKPMNIEGIYSLYQFMVILNKLCKRDEEHFNLNICNQNRRYDNSHADYEATGINFEITFKLCNNNKIRKVQTRGWIGIYFNQEKPIISIGFWNHKNWGKNIYNLLKKKNIENKGEYSSVPYEVDNAYWLDFIEGKDINGKSFNKLTLDEQIMQMKSFMDEVFNIIYELIE